MIREKLPQATIITFWHIPWPNAGAFGICPWREELLEGLLGSSILGFHTQFHCNNFLDTVDRFLEARIDREDSTVVPRRAGHGRAAVSHLDRVAAPLARHAAARSSECRAHVRQSSASRPTRCWASASIGWTTRRASRSGSRRSNAYWSAADAGRTVHVRPDCGAEPDAHRPVPAPQRADVEALAARINERFGSRRLPADRACTSRTTSRRRSSSYLSRGRPLLREQSSRRHEPRRQGVRCGARRRARRARSEPVRRRRRASCPKR